jgi:anti-sigma factor RsiW
MSCRDVEPRFDDLLDGELGGAAAAAVRSHLTGCASCRGELERRERLIAQARALPASVAPPRDLWPGIATRLGLEPRLRVSSWPAWLGAVAAAVMVAAVVTGMLVGPRQAGDRGRSVAGNRRAGDVRAAIGSSERDFRVARSALLEALEQRRGTLSEGTVRVVLEGVRVIDGAIATISGALDQHPGNAGLARRLAAAYRQEIDLLQRVTRLPDET